MSRAIDMQERTLTTPAILPYGQDDPGAPISAGRALLLAIPLLLVLLLGLSMGKHLDHDEHQFIASGALFEREGLLPYRDYPYFHVPNLIFVYAALDKFSSHLLLAARSFNVLCSTATLSILLVLGLRRFAIFGRMASLFAALGIVAAVMFNPVYVFTSGKAWNHDLPVLLTLLAVLSLWRWREARGGTALAWIAAAGMLFGLAVGTRLTFAPCGAAFIGSILVTSRQTRGAKLAAIACFGAAALIALMPTIYFIAIAPRQFWFGNFQYPALNTAYRKQEGFERSMTALGKLAYLFKDLLIRPGNLLLAVAAGASLIAFRNKPDQPPHPRRFEMFSLAALVGTLLIGSFAPTPLWWSYFFAPIPFMALFGLCVAADPRKSPAQAKGWWIALGAFIGVTVACGIPKLVMETASMLRPDQWVPMRLHEQGRDIAARCGSGPILTLSPLIPLEGGCKIYEPWATGPFALRIADMVGKTDKELFGEMDLHDIEFVLGRRPPAGVLIGYEDALEIQLRTRAFLSGYVPVSPRDPGDAAVRAIELWVLPPPNPPHLEVD